MENIRLNFAHICENAFLSQDGKINIIGDFDRISIKRQIPEAPLFFSFYVVTNFTVDPDKQYTQEILLINTINGSEIAKQKVEQDIKNEKIGIIAQFNVQFPSEGLYKIVIKLNGSLYNELPLKVEEKK